MAVTASPRDRLEFGRAWGGSSSSPVSVTRSPAAGSSVEVSTAYELYPTWTPVGCVYDLQVVDMRRLHQLSRQGRRGRRELGELMLARDAAKSLSRHDMARATGLDEDQVERLIAEHRDRHMRAFPTEPTR